MQFGRVHGFLLIGLGLLLLGIQAVLSLAYHAAPTPAPSAPPTSTSAPAPERRDYPVPGILGAFSLLGGLAVFATRRRVDEPPAKDAVH